MPEVIDNVKVGEYIKNLLKERNMTQSQLAELLHVSKSAISQNLSGKSSFDIQNLIKISDIFEISLDVLLSLKTDDERDVISEYERLVRRGLDEIKEISSERINISIPDLYGKVFIEYVIEYDNIDVFNYLLKNNITLFQREHSNAKEVYLKIISYMIDKQMDGFMNFVHNYVIEYGSFKIPNEGYEKAIITGLEKYNSKDIIKSLMTLEVKQKIAYFKFIYSQDYLKILTVKDWAKLIGKYHAENLLDVLLSTSNVIEYLEDIVRYFVMYGFKKGLYTIQKSVSEEKINSLRHSGEHLQNIIELVSDFDDIKLFKQYINHGIYKDLTKLTIKCIKTNKEDLYNYLINTQTQKIDFRLVGKSLVKQKEIKLLNKFKKHFTDDDLDYFISISDEKENDLNIALLLMGAKINSKYLNRNTTTKLNNILEVLLKKGDNE